jgi:hypothetical protein
LADRSGARHHLQLSVLGHLWVAGHSAIND